MTKSLTEFEKESRRKHCPVCAVIPVEIRKEIRDGKRKKISGEVVVRWLKEVHKLSVTVEQLKSHGSAGHDADLMEE